MQTNAYQIQTGTAVHGSDGEKIGDVSGVADDYFIIEKGFILTTDVFVPMSAITSADDDRIELSFTKDQVENQEWSAPAGGTDDGYVAGSDTDATAGTADETYAGDVIERREERLTVDTTTHTGSAHVEDTVRREEFDIEDDTRETGDTTRGS